MHQAIQLPLTLHLLFAPQAEAIQTFIAANVAEHGLNYRHAMTVNRFALLAIDSVLHPVGVIWCAFVFNGEGDLSAGAVAVVRRSGILHTFVLLRTVATLQQATYEVHSDFAVQSFPLPSISKCLAGWADTGQLHWIELEFTRCKGAFPTLVGEVLMPLTVLVFLLRELWITAAEAIVRDVTVDLLLMQVLHIGFVGEAGVGGHDRAGLIDVVGNAELFIATLNRLQHRL